MRTPIGCVLRGHLRSGIFDQKSTRSGSRFLPGHLDLLRGVTDPLEEAIDRDRSVLADVLGIIAG